MEQVKKSLELSRIELLDMGLRGNTLLHFRHGAKTLEIVDELSVQVFDLLVSQQKYMTFTPIPDALDKSDEESDEESETLPLPQLLEELYGESRHSDNKLQTKLNADKLDKKLLKVNNEANTYYQEQGVDILYLALGFLTWYENKNSDKPRIAPLVLVPVSLERATAKERYKLTYTQADLGPNLSLAAKLKIEFSLILPEFSDELDIQEYFNQVATCIKDQPRWSVNENEIALGFFSFGKFQMYQDLDSSNWPKNKKPEQHSLLQSLMGGGFSGDETIINHLDTDSRDNCLVDLTELNFVKDSDSSQTEAVMSVKRGDNLVIQGPPGTGKSQTITNIISESIAANKTVLFVAEKMAALEVVKRRLDESHLGDGVLELHSHKSNKRAVLEELKRTLELGAPKSPDRELFKARHQQLRKRLDDYSEAVNTPIMDSGITYIQALGLHLQLKKSDSENTLPDMDFASMQNWDNQNFVEACGHVSELIDHLTAMGVPEESFFAEAGIDEFSPVEQNQLASTLKRAKASVLECHLEGVSLAKEMHLTAPETVGQVSAICRAAERAIAAPHLTGLTLTTDEWQQKRDHITALLDSGAAIKKLKFSRSEQLIEQAWDADLLSVRQLYASIGKKWWKFLSGDFRRAKQCLQGLSKGDVSNDVNICLALIDDVLKVQTLKTQFQRYEPLGQRLFGAQWQAEESDWDVLGALSDWVIELYNEVGKGKLPDGILRFLEGDHALVNWTERLGLLDDSSASLKEVLVGLSKSLQLSSKVDLSLMGLIELEVLLTSWIDNLDELYPMARYNRIRKTLCENNLTLIDQHAFSWRQPPELLLVALKLTWYEGLVNVAYAQSESIKQFDRISHEAAIEEFKQLDEALFYHAQESLVSGLYERLPSGASGEMAIIRKEMNKKRRHMPLRGLIRQTGRAIQKIKPVFMMSPMSVATYLEQGAAEFDLVIFDEASQVKVVDALGAILRGKQVVVVGDAKQMPPTNFFGKAMELDDDEADASHTADIESILGMFLSQGAPESMLKWHYRSRHDSLIAVSNQEFYEGKLMIFPSPGVNPRAKGLSFNYVSDGVYERGGSRTNPIEARRVAEAVIAHAKLSPELTLGVVSFSTAQRDCILLEVERLRRENDETEPFFNNGSLESFFVKNLENVQGDERDVIYISIGYGKTATGNVSRSFGPLNTEGGHRRLNVLISRARLAMEVFSNFTADELATTATTPFGVRSLKAFLSYAETGELKNHKETGKETDSPFEDQVISAVKALGYDVEPQVGSAGFFIDIAVRDPAKPGRYILAIECDGASYHSSANARDRDRLRQSVLEGLGWRFHRIWSTDWFRNSYKEVERVQEAIKSAIAYYIQLDEQSVIQHSSSISSAPVVASIKRSEASPEPEVAANLYTLAEGDLGIPFNQEIHYNDVNVLAAAVSKVVEIEGAIHIKEAARRIAENAGFSRVGVRILDSVNYAADSAHQRGSLYKEGDFLYKDSSKTVDIRDRSKLPAAMKKIEFVPSEEITAAIIKTVEMAFSLPSKEAISEALSMLGFQRATENIRLRMDDELNGLVIGRRLINQGGVISVS